MQLNYPDSVDDIDLSNWTFWRKSLEEREGPHPMREWGNRYSARIWTEEFARTRADKELYIPIKEIMSEM